MNNNFWYEALKAGTIIGLVCAAFSMMKMYMNINEMMTWAKILSVVNVIVFVALVFAFTRRYSISAGGDSGFTYGNGMSFVFASMIFTGIIVGVYSALAYRFLFYDYVKELIDTTMVGMQDMVADETFDKMYDTTKKMMFNPITQVMSNIFMYFIAGGFVGLIVCGFTKREPDWTKSDDNDIEENGN